MTSLSILALIALLFGTFALEKKKEAETAAIQATRNYESVLEAERQITKTVRRELPYGSRSSYLSGTANGGGISAKVAAELLEIARGSFETVLLLHDDIDSKKLRLDLFTELFQSFAQLNDIEAVLKAALEAKKTATALIQLDPNDLEAKYSYVRALHSLASAHRLQFAVNLFTQEFEEAAEAARELENNDGSNLRWKALTALTEQGSGDSHVARGQLDAAYVHYSKYIAQLEFIAKYLARSAQEKIQTKRKLAIAHGQLADVLFAQGFQNIERGQVLEGETRLRSAENEEAINLVLSRALLDKEPANVDYIRGLGIAEERYAYFLRRTCRLRLAFDTAREAKILDRILFDKDVTNKSWHLNLSYIYMNLGDLYNDMGMYLQALLYYRSYMTAMREIVRSEPLDKYTQRDLTVSHQRLSDIYARMSFYDAAARERELCLAGNSEYGLFNVRSPGPRDPKAWCRSQRIGSMVLNVPDGIKCVSLTRARSSGHPFK